MMRPVALCLFALLLSSPYAGAQTDPQQTVTRYCLGCHGAKAKVGGLSLDLLTVDGAANHPGIWEKVIKRTRARHMPPVGLPRPDEASYIALISALESKLDTAAREKPNPGRTDTFRRLNRTEYRNAIRDLLALDVDVSALLPPDEISHGFDNITVGELSPTLLESYLTAARKIGRLALGIPPKQPGGDTIVLPPDLTQEKHFDALPFGTRGGTVVSYTFPVDGEFEIQIRLQRDRNEHVEGLYEPHNVDLMLDGKRIARFTARPPGTGKDHSQVDTQMNHRLTVKAGRHTLAVAFPKIGDVVLETERKPYEANFNMDRHPRPQPALYSISVNGPYQVAGPGDTETRRRIFTCRPATAADEDDCARRIVANLARRAYRRPVTDSDTAAPLEFYRRARAGESFETGIEMALRAILVSPEFLFRVEQDPAGAAPGSAYRLSGVALASRLSFFLWSSIPDEALLNAAAAGKLQDPAELERQVTRMLADPRSAAMVENFAGQWLYLRNLESTTPDMRLFTDFDDNLRRAFRRETELFVENVMREDLPIFELLRARYSFLNERLAKHYEIPNVYGSRFRKVEFPSGNPRGGLLTHGSVLTVTSYATRTSPVIRGKWIMENILGVPAPAPPPVVPALTEAKAMGKFLTMRERLAQHRDNPACSGCHRLMDPTGFSLENFDAVGRWRTHENFLPVDADGELPDGSKFQGVAGLQKAILARPELFASAFTEKLMTYALGRGVETYDGPAVRQVIRDAAAKNYRFSSFIVGIVKSTPFQMRRAL